MVRVYRHARVGEEHRQPVLALQRVAQRLRQRTPGQQLDALALLAAPGEELLRDRRALRLADRALRRALHPRPADVALDAVQTADQRQRRPGRVRVALLGLFAEPPAVRPALRVHQQPGARERLLAVPGQLLEPPSSRRLLQIQYPSRSNDRIFIIVLRRISFRIPFQLCDHRVSMAPLLRSSGSRTRCRAPRWGRALRRRERTCGAQDSALDVRPHRVPRDGTRSAAGAGRCVI